MSAPMCGVPVYWYDAGEGRGPEYEGQCELEPGHDGDHWDGLSWYDNDGNKKDHDHPPDYVQGLAGGPLLPTRADLTETFARYRKGPS